MNEKPKRSKRPNCYVCSHYYVTWDKRFPCGCRAMEFKSRRLPSDVVYENSGIECQLFKRRKVERKA